MTIVPAGWRARVLGAFPDEQEALQSTAPRLAWVVAAFLVVDSAVLLTWKDANNSRDISNVPEITIPPDASPVPPDGGTIVTADTGSAGLPRAWSSGTFSTTATRPTPSSTFGVPIPASAGTRATTPTTGSGSPPNVAP